MIKHGNKILLVATMLLFALSCTDEVDDDVDDGNWIRKSSFEGVGRSGAVAFVVGDKAYVGLGYDGDDYLVDFWSYDPDQNFWQRVADFPGEGRTSAVAFSIGNKGYVGTGYDGIYKLKDFWEYNASTNSWQQIQDFGGSARINSIAFSANDKGYVGTGYDGNYLKDFWEYDPSTGNWEQIVSLKGEKRESGLAMTIDGQVFVGTGTNNGLYETDFWQFDPSNIDWIEKTELDDDDDYEIIRSNAVSFSVGEYGYTVTGSYSSNLTTTWQYDPGLDTWSEKTSFEGSAREEAVAFTVKGRAYVALGKNGSSRYDDIWEFDPTQELDEDD